MAGDSAEQVARRAREKAERLLKRAEMFEKGAEGERLVGELLEQLPDDWFVLNDIHWPGRNRANIDHVVIGPSGVFVIDTKNWSAPITIKGNVLRCGGYSQMRAVQGVQAAADAIGSLIPSVPPSSIIPMLCFVGDAQAHGVVSGVEICTPEMLVQTLMYMPIVFSSDELAFLRFQLDASTGAALGPKPPVYLMPPPSGPPPFAARPVARAARNRHRSTRPSVFKKVMGALALWWLFCALAYSAIGRLVHNNPSVLGSAYLLAGVFAASLMASPRPKGRSHRR